MAWYDELQRRSTSAETAVRLYEARSRIDVIDSRRVRHDADAGRARARGSRRAGRGGPAARRAHPGRAPRPAGVGEPHPARRRARVGRVRGRAARVPRHGAGSRPAAELGSQPARAGRARARGGGPDQRGDRRASEPERAHGRAAPLQRLREAARLRQGGPRRRRRAVLRSRYVQAASRRPGRLRGGTDAGRGKRP